MICMDIFQTITQCCTSNHIFFPNMMNDVAQYIHGQPYLHHMPNNQWELVSIYQPDQLYKSNNISIAF